MIPRVINGGPAGFKLALDSSDGIHMAYCLPPGGLHYRYKPSPTAPWSAAQIVSTPACAPPAIAIDNSGQPVIAQRRYDGSVWVTRRDATMTWTEALVDPTAGGHRLSLAIVPAGALHLAYVTTAWPALAGDIKYARVCP